MFYREVRINNTPVMLQDIICVAKQSVTLRIHQSCCVRMRDVRNTPGVLAMRLS
jgi:hypothetical protein